MKKILLALILFSLATGQVMAKIKVIGNNASVGCIDSDLVTKLYQYAHKKDTAAFRDAYLPAISQGTCTKFKKGEKVVLIDSKVLAGQVKVRREDDNEGFWIILDDIY